MVKANKKLPISRAFQRLPCYLLPVTTLRSVDEPVLNGSHEIQSHFFLKSRYATDGVISVKNMGHDIALPITADVNLWLATDAFPAEPIQ